MRVLIVMTLFMWMFFELMSDPQFMEHMWKLLMDAENMLEFPLLGQGVATYDSSCAHVIWRMEYLGTCRYSQNVSWRG